MNSNKAVHRHSDGFADKRKESTCIVISQKSPAASSQACDKAVGSALLLEEATEAMLAGE